MKEPVVFFTDFNTTTERNIEAKFRELLKQAGIGSMHLKQKIVALKMHFGEPGNLAFLRPNYTAWVVDIIKKMGGLPFATDCNTLYKGRRSNAVDHLQAAAENGFNALTLGCHIIIGDGLKGTDYRETDIHLKHCNTAKIGTAIADADVLITINHFKGHEMAGFGGCLKNLGMGCGSVGGKLFMHSDSQPGINRKNCSQCGTCFDHCAYNAIHPGPDGIAAINYDLCTGCGQCIAVCRYDAAHVRWDAVSMQEKMMEYAFAAVKNKPALHLNFLTDISPNCDCWPNNNPAITPDLGILASFDPVAIDKASVDMINTSPWCTGHHNNEQDKFKSLYPDTDWRKGLDYAESIGLGKQKYKLITVN